MQSEPPTNTGGEPPAVEGHDAANPVKKRGPSPIPPELRSLQKSLEAKEHAADNARKARNIEVARLRDEAKISQYRIAKWLGVTERAVMLMAKQGREYGAEER